MTLDITTDTLLPMDVITLQPTAMPHDPVKAQRFADFIAAGHVFPPIEVERPSFTRIFQLMESRHR
jgi:hypothetical protein